MATDNLINTLLISECTLIAIGWKQLNATLWWRHNVSGFQDETALYCLDCHNTSRTFTHNEQISDSVSRKFYGSQSRKWFLFYHIINIWTKKKPGFLSSQSELAHLKIRFCSLKLMGLCNCKYNLKYSKVHISRNKTITKYKWQNSIWVSDSEILFLFIGLQNVSAGYPTSTACRQGSYK